MERYAGKIHFVASQHLGAEDLGEEFKQRYGHAPLEQAEVIVALGGDGFMLRTLHRLGATGHLVYGMKLGNVGFLMNRLDKDELPERLARAQVVELKPLKMTAYSDSGEKATALAINEVSLLRQSNQAAKITILVNDVVRVEELVCDGVLVATPAGSTAYNFSVHGPILPLGTEALALTPISPFRPRRWRGAILPAEARVTFQVRTHERRPVSATADTHVVKNVVRVEVEEDQANTLRLLFDPDHSLEERIIQEQFL